MIPLARLNSIFILFIFCCTLSGNALAEENPETISNTYTFYLKNSQGVHITNSVMWQNTLSQTMKLHQAEQYCEDLTLGGFDDWRLPSLDELNTTVDKSVARPPYIKQGYSVSIIPSYWTSTESDKGLQFYLNYQTGESVQTGKVNRLSVRCIRIVSSVEAKKK